MDIDGITYRSVEKAYIAEIGPLKLGRIFVVDPKLLSFYSVLSSAISQ